MLYLSAFTKGNGGNAGHLTLYVNKQVRGKVTLKTCAGKGAQAAINGKGGKGNTLSRINHDGRLLEREDSLTLMQIKWLIRLN